MVLQYSMIGFLRMPNQFVVRLYYMGDGRGAVFCPALCYSRYIDQAVFEIHGVSLSLRVHEIAKMATNDC